MELNQLHSAALRVVSSLESSGMMLALENYRASLNGVGNAEEAKAQVIKASDAYIEKTSLFDNDEIAVVNVLDLGQFSTSSYWVDLTASHKASEVRKAQSVSAYGKLLFATSQLPNFLTSNSETFSVDEPVRDSKESERFLGIKYLFPGFLISALIALAAQFISEHYGAPSMLMALLFGIALNFLSDDSKCQSGITFSARTVLRIGVALLGMRISFDMAADLGWPIISVIIGSMIATILFGLLIARFFGHGPRFAFLSAGSVAICGASAAMAISAILPRDERTEERLVFTVVGVTLLSTFSMIVYPIIADALHYDTKIAGIFIGATIHDVAQVVGAGFSISEGTGDVATVVKLVRVAMLAPIILIASVFIRRMSSAEQDKSQKPPLVPTFVAVFAFFVALNSFGFLPVQLTALAAEVSRWALLTAIAAVGMKTELREVINVGVPAISLLVAETVFIGCLVIAALHWIS